jgi:hypothetical protein
VERLAALDPRERADDRDLRVGVLTAEFGDGVVVLLIEENDALEDSGERLGTWGRRIDHGFHG